MKIAGECRTGIELGKNAKDAAGFVSAGATSGGISIIDKTLSSTI